MASPGFQLRLKCAMRVSDGNIVPQSKSCAVDTTNIEEHQTASAMDKEAISNSRPSVE